MVKAVVNVAANMLQRENYGVWDELFDGKYSIVYAEDTIRKSGT